MKIYPALNPALLPDYVIVNTLKYITSLQEIYYSYKKENKSTVSSKANTYHPDTDDSFFFDKKKFLSKFYSLYNREYLARFNKVYHTPYNIVDMQFSKEVGNFEFDFYTQAKICRENLQELIISDKIPLTYQGKTVSKQYLLELLSLTRSISYDFKGFRWWASPLEL